MTAEGRYEWRTLKLTRGESIYWDSTGAGALRNISSILSMILWKEMLLGSILKVRKLRFKGSNSLRQDQSVKDNKIFVLLDRIDLNALFPTIPWYFSLVVYRSQFPLGIKKRVKRGVNNSINWLKVPSRNNALLLSKVQKKHQMCTGRVIYQRKWVLSSPIFRSFLSVDMCLMSSKYIIYCDYMQ